MTEITDIVKKACEAKTKLYNLDIKFRDEALKNIAHEIEENKDKIYGANKEDLILSQKKVDEGKLTQATFNRLKLDENKMRDMIKGVYDVINLENPINKVLWARELDKGLVLKKITCPIGLIGIIFEARPDVMVQITSLAIKSGNAVILKGGSEAENTNKAFFEIIQNALKKTPEFPLEAVNLIFSREDIKSLLSLDEYIDLIIPRGSNKLVTYIQSNTKIPVLGHASGICHIFVDKTAKRELVENVTLDAKIQYPSACNAVETVLVHKEYPYLNELKNHLIENGVKIVENPESYSCEYSDKILTVKTVNSLAEAIEHINKYGSHHTDSILTEEAENAEKFMTMVDSAGVFHNTSTRFSDGFRYGFGAEVGISTNKTLARGPVGLEGLCIYKYRLYGEGQTVGDYAKGVKQFHHRDI